MKIIKSALINQITGAIIGIFIAWITYLITSEKTDPVFIVDNIRSVLISKESVKGQPIKIFRVDGEEVTEDLVSVTFYLFNRGKAPLMKEHVVNNLKLRLDDPAAEIVGFQIAKSSRPDISATLTLDTMTPLPTLNIDFNFLEKNDGFTGQLTYLGARRPL